MSAPAFLEFHASDVDLKFKVALLANDNPDVVDEVVKRLPLESVLGHVVISGESFWLPTRIVHLGRNNMVRRTLGAVYLYAPGQTICLCYGSITESASINKFGQVVESDLPILRRLGQSVYEQTVANPKKNLVRVTVRGAA
ncbi:MAG: hypothetical protein HYR63_22420 [Proteobacteria bacterium]|nr:hypothetical protein [Pseudomonadota bacterium]MBI3497604.1 hypothetical protein [Pseudomonadota bacterium]